MPTLKFNHNILEYLHEINGVKYDSKDWEKRMPSIGCVVEENDEEGIEIEIFPDRTDLLSHETISRADAKSWAGLPENLHRQMCRRSKVVLMRHPYARP